MAKMGRPTDYTPELGDYICELVATHPVGLPQLCEMYSDTLPHEISIRRWRYKFTEFSTKYAKAKIDQADLLAEECLAVANDSSRDTSINKHGEEILNTEFVARSRLKIDTYKWLASKLLPKQYGDRLALEQKTEENEELKEELRVLRKKLDEQNKKDY